MLIPSFSCRSGHSGLDAGVTMSPARMDPDPASPVGLPMDRRSPTPAEKLPQMAYGEEQVIAL